jgi:hypothetical protein
MVSPVDGNTLMESILESHGCRVSLAVAKAITTNSNIFDVIVNLINKYPILMS